jgi:hypothetical protein
VVAEQLLHVLDLLDQPLRRLAQDGRSSLCGIPQPLGCLAGPCELADTYFETVRLV